MKPGDIIERGKHQWRIRGIHLGAEGQESLIEIENISHSNGWTGEWEYHPVMWVPEILLRDCKILEAA